MLKYYKALEPASPKSQAQYEAWKLERAAEIKKRRRERRLKENQRLARQAWRKKAQRIMTEKRQIMAEIADIGEELRVLKQARQTASEREIRQIVLDEDNLIARERELQEELCS